MLSTLVVNYYIDYTIIIQDKFNVSLRESTSICMLTSFEEQKKKWFFQTFFDDSRQKFTENV